MKSAIVILFMLVLCVVSSLGTYALVPGQDGPKPGDSEWPRVYTHWESFHKEDGLPSEKIYCIAVDSDRVWAGTDDGLALYENGKWTKFGVADGLAYPAVLCLAIDPETRDLWAGTMKGLSRHFCRPV